MLKKTITYDDWNGKTRTEDFYFNLTRTEIAELEYGLGLDKSLTETLETIVDNKDISTVIRLVKELLLAAFGIKSEDGRRFIKNQEVREAFEQNPAFDIIYMNLATDPEYAVDFLLGIIPREAIDNLGSNPKKEVLDRINAVIDDTSGEH